MQQFLNRIRNRVRSLLTVYKKKKNNIVKCISTDAPHTTHNSVILIIQFFFSAHFESQVEHSPKSNTIAEAQCIAD